MSTSAIRFEIIIRDNDATCLAVLEHIGLLAENIVPVLDNVVSSTLVVVPVPDLPKEGPRFKEIVKDLLDYQQAKIGEPE